MIYPAAAARAVAFTPQSLSPLIWLDATQLGLSDGASVSSFTDLSGNGNHFIQATGSKQPVFRATGINGRGAVEGDGVDDTLALASMASQANWWEFTVGLLVAFTSTVNAWSVDDYVPDGTYILAQLNGANSLISNASMGALSGEVSAGVGTKRAYLFKGSATGATLKADNATVGTSVANYSKATAAMRLFARGDGLYSNYRIGERIFGSGVLTADQETAVWTYFNGKWGTGIP